MTLAEKTRLIDCLVLIIPLQSYSKSVDIFDLKGYVNIDEHPDFANLKQIYEERSQQIQQENKMRLSK